MTEFISALANAYMIKYGQAPTAQHVHEWVVLYREGTKR